jgi:iron(III)-enterobactin esterase
VPATEDKSLLPIPYREEKIAGVHSKLLNRDVDVNLLLPDLEEGRRYPLLLLNDGQDMSALRLKEQVENLVNEQVIEPIIVAGVVAGDRLQEYGVANKKDYLKRGSRAKAYTQYITTELLPYLEYKYPVALEANHHVMAGCSMGGLSAVDIVWNHPKHFEKVGAFSGSFWWRRRDSRSPFYSDHRDRIMHHEIKHGKKKDNLKFWLQTGTLDEQSDRNKNGVIDSIDDTLDLIAELTKKGYRPFHDIVYHEIENGQHNIETWADAMPVFLKWAFGK